ncbi:hypothetical protein [Pseudochelatococcus contaminans]|uniref:Uncharacterized protein n=1 Tax=Pseudochelatococcus contaminans TaxID=1538103 RepID=A0A7W5Z7M7_9HYPH|nr:hypothetical protein [Pseudochelatococcus contaminans]MBB3811469.1 hypothetical protein [Pseudochelatococcus contaminans]
MRYRKLDANGDMVFGNGGDSFYHDVPDAPAQAITTRLKLGLGEWFLDLKDGTPWKTRVLGKYTGFTRDPMLRSRILKTQGVKSLDAYSSSVNVDTRRFEVSATVSTAYGQITVRGPV